VAGSTRGSAAFRTATGISCTFACRLPRSSNLHRAGIVTTDPETASRGAEAATFSGTTHLIGAALDYTPVAALVLSFVLAPNPACRSVRKRVFITAGITLIALGAFMAVLPYDGHVGPGVLVGLFGPIPTFLLRSAK
jgi:hypothetical protein